MRKTGLFVTLEGGDGSGKTTLLESLYTHLKQEGHDCIKTRAPGGTALGQKIRHLLLDQNKMTLSQRAEILLFLADRAQHVDEVILPALQSNQIVLCDRFNDSTIAYQGGARGLGEDRVKELCSFACNSIQPDLTFYLDLDPQIGFQRCKKAGMKKDRIESEPLTFHQKIRATFHEIASLEKQRFRLIDAHRSKEEVLKQALLYLSACLQERK